MRRINSKGLLLRSEVGVFWVEHCVAREISDDSRVLVGIWRCFGVLFRLCNHRVSKHSGGASFVFSGVVNDLSIGKAFLNVLKRSIRCVTINVVENRQEKYIFCERVLRCYAVTRENIYPYMRLRVYAFSRVWEICV